VSTISLWQKRFLASLYGCIIGDKSDEGQDASLPVEMGNVGQY